ncbi:hypothetical protein [Nocardia carnea]|uniref:hypothetical protein n=1 Tax=Nocardia carnea TaxID=37328 RepID=UPI0024583AA2|nr:hypothetical protein [Nocardia carnea]
MSVTLNAQDKATLRTAAYGAVSLITATSAFGGSAHKAATGGSLALATATGSVGHALADVKAKDIDLQGKNIAELADQVFPALTAAMNLLKQQDAAEADNFRATVLVALETATRTRRGAPSPALSEMTRKITSALDAA